MLNLKEYIKESILDDEDAVFNDDNIKLEIEKFIKDNYNYQQFMISNKSNKDGKFVVDGTDILVTNKNITSLTNNFFVWGKVKRDFNCAYCNSLISLEGAPEEVGWDFYCSYCYSLKSLKGAPEKVGGSFNCSYCYSLKSLKDAPEKVNRSFYCSYCDSLISLEGAPKKIGDDFYCIGNKFSIEDIEKVVKAKQIKI